MADLVEFDVAVPFLVKGADTFFSPGHYRITKDDDGIIGLDYRKDSDKKPSYKRSAILQTVRLPNEPNHTAVAVQAMEDGSYMFTQFFVEGKAGWDIIGVEK